MSASEINRILKEELGENPYGFSNEMSVALLSVFRTYCHSVVKYSHNFSKTQSRNVISEIDVIEAINLINPDNHEVRNIPQQPSEIHQTRAEIAEKFKENLP